MNAHSYSQKVTSQRTGQMLYLKNVPLGNHRFRVQSFHPGTDVGVSCDFSLLVEFCYDFYDLIVKCVTGSLKIRAVVHHDGLQVRAPRAPTSLSGH